MSVERAIHPSLNDVDADTVIDKSSPIPLHHQLELFLRHSIESGRFPPHTTLPTEQELQEYFQLSRTPVRQALAKLAADGLVDRRRSHGTVVLPKPFEENLRTLTTFTEEVRNKGQTPGSQLLEFKVLLASSDDRRLLNLSDGAKVFVVRRLRFIDNEPVGILTSHIPVSVAPRLSAEDFAESGPRQSIYYVLEHLHGVKPVRASETFRAVSLDAETARLLHMATSSAVLMRSRVTYDASGSAVALEYGLYRGIYRIEWSGRAISSFDTSSLPDSQDE